MTKRLQVLLDEDEYEAIKATALAKQMTDRGAGAMLRFGGLFVLLLALVSCDVSVSISTPTGDSPSTGEAALTPVPFGHDPYLDGQPPSFLWHYPPPPEGLVATPLQEDGVMLDWEPVYGAAGYDVLHYPYAEGVVLTPENIGDESLGFDTYARIGDLFTSQTFQQVSDLECEQMYLFEVRAIGAGPPVDMSIDPDQKDYGSPSRVIVSPCATEPATSVPHAGLCPEEGSDCLFPSQKVALSSGWPPFQAVYSTLHHRTRTHDCPDGQYYESRLQVKHMDFRTDYNHRTTVIADSEWAYPEIFCSGSGFGLWEGVGSYEEKKGLIRTTYNALEYSGSVERTKTLSLFSNDLTEHLGYYERIFGRDNPAVLILAGIRPDQEFERPRGFAEDYDGVCYRNVCESKDAAIRYGEDLVTNDAYEIPLVLATLDGAGESLRVHRLWIDADRTP